jgi:hypothetical protein
MTAFLDVYRFEYWDGPPPGIVAMNVESQARPGASGLSHTLLGYWGHPFQVTLTSFHTTAQEASERHALLCTLIGTGPKVLEWESIPWSALHGVMYNVESVELVDIRAASYLAGPGLSFTNGGVKLVVRVTLTPQKA